MEQREVHQQPTQIFTSISRFRAKRLSKSLCLNDAESERSSTLNKGTFHTNPERDEENIPHKSLSLKKQREIRFPLMPIRNESNSMELDEGFRGLGSHSAKKQEDPKPNSNFRRRHLRRSCAPNLINLESVLPMESSYTPYGTNKRKQIGTLSSSITKSSESHGESQSLSKPIGSDFRPRFKSRLKGRRSILLRQGRDLEASTQSLENEDSLENTNGQWESVRKRNIVEDEEENNKGASLRSSHFTSRSIIDKEEEEAKEKKSEKKSRFSFELGKPRRRRSSIVDMLLQKAHASKSSIKKPGVVSERRYIPSSLVRSEAQDSPSRDSTEQKDLMVMETNREELQECRRALKFESSDVEEGTEDHTAPLVQLDQTSILNQASVLKNPINLPQKVSEPVIKKNLLDDTGKVKFRRRRRSTLITQQLKDHSRQPLTVDTHTSNKLDTSSCEEPFCVENKPGNISFSSCTLMHNTIKEEEAIKSSCTLSPKKTNISTRTLGVTLKEDKPTTSSCTQSSKKINVSTCNFGYTTIKEEEPSQLTTSSCPQDSERKSNFSTHLRSTKKVQRRRSAAVLCVRTPMRRKSAHLEAKSTSKLPVSVSSKLPIAKGSQRHCKLKRSLLLPPPLVSQHQMTNKMDASVMDCSGENENQICSINNSQSQMVDASTNTTINLAKIKHVDFKILEDIEALLEEQNELSTKAAQIQKSTTARRLEMKEKKVMESFMISISPLRRLKAIFSQNNKEEMKNEETLPHIEPEGSGGCVGSGVITLPQDQSTMEWESPKAPLKLAKHQVQWRRRQHDNRLTRACTEPVIGEEEFSKPCKGNTSPFTALVGDCERPSLAPMTPHSRNNVFFLKQSLMDQMKHLYD